MLCTQLEMFLFYTTRLHYLFLDAFLLSLISFHSNLFPIAHLLDFFSVNSSSLAFCSLHIFRHFFCTAWPSSSSGAKRDAHGWLDSAERHISSPELKRQTRKRKRRKKAHHEVSYRHPHHMGKELKSAGLYITLGHITEHILPFLLLFFFSFSPLRSTKRASSLAQLMAN